MTEITTSITFTVPDVSGTGTVILKRLDPSVTDVNWEIKKPDGSTLSVSSITDGLVEALAYAKDNNYNLQVVGGSIDPLHLNANVIAFLNSSRLIIGPFDSANIDLGNTNLTFAGQGITSGAAVTVDSFSKGDLNHYGQIVCNHLGTAILFRPSSVHTGDADKNQGVSNFNFKIVEQANTFSGSKAVEIFPENGQQIHGSNYKFEEINGGNIGVSLNTSGTGVITGSNFKFLGIHGFNSAGLEVFGNTNNCMFDIEISTPQNCTTTNINSSNCKYNINDVTPYKTKIIISSDAKNNEINIFSQQLPEIINLSTNINRIFHNGQALLCFSVQCPVGDITQAGISAGKFAIIGRQTYPRELLVLEAIHQTTNGTGASGLVSVRIADTLTPILEILSDGRIKALQPLLRADGSVI